jgi:hypothetical protein
LHHGRATASAAVEVKHGHPEIEFAMASGGSPGAEPRTAQEALNSPQSNAWADAMEEEINQLEKANAWEIVIPPPSANVLRSRYVFRTKHDSNNEVDRYRARFVAKGNTQVYGIDYTETFAPVVKLSTLRVILALAAQRDCEIHHMDVKSAYLNTELKETIYVQPPHGYLEGKEKYQHLNKAELRPFALLLKKALYGTKQGACGWYKKLAEVMKTFGFRICSSDQAVFLMGEGTETSIVAAVFIDTILARLNLTNARPLSTPMEPGTILVNEQSPTTKEKIEDMRDVPYLEGLGSLMYVCQGMRFDISLPVSLCSRFMHNSGHVHWEAAKIIFRYLKGTRDLRLHLGGINAPPHGYSDADHGSQKDQHSISGYAFFNWKLCFCQLKEAAYYCFIQHRGGVYCDDACNQRSHLAARTHRRTKLAIEFRVTTQLRQSICDCFIQG